MIEPFGVRAAKASARCHRYRAADRGSKIQLAPFDVFQELQQRSVQHGPAQTTALLASSSKNPISELDAEALERWDSLPSLMADADP